MLKKAVIAGRIISSIICCTLCNYFGSVSVPTSVHFTIHEMFCKLHIFMSSFGIHLIMFVFDIKPLCYKLSFGKKCLCAF